MQPKTALKSRGPTCKKTDSSPYYVIFWIENIYLDEPQCHFFLFSFWEGNDVSILVFQKSFGHLAQQAVTLQSPAGCHLSHLLLLWSFSLFFSDQNAFTLNARAPGTVAFSHCWLQSSLLHPTIPMPHTWLYQKDCFLSFLPVKFNKVHFS